MASPRTLYNKIVVNEGLTAGDSGSATVTSFDRLNGSNPVHDLVGALVVGTVTGTVTVTMVESDTTDVASAMDAVATGEVQGGNPLLVTTANDNQTHYLGYAGSKRYVGFTIAGDFSGSLWTVAADARGSIR